jgi:hypothetical protein
MSAYKRRDRIFEEKLAQRADKLGLPKRHTNWIEEITRWMFALLFLSVMVGCSEHKYEIRMMRGYPGLVGLPVAPESFLVRIDMESGTMCAVGFGSDSSVILETGPAVVGCGRNAQ